MPKCVGFSIKMFSNEEQPIDWRLVVRILYIILYSWHLPVSYDSLHWQGLARYCSDYVSLSWLLSHMALISLLAPDSVHRFSFLLSSLMNFVEFYQPWLNLFLGDMNSTRLTRLYNNSPLSLTTAKCKASTGVSVSIHNCPQISSFLF